MSERLLFPFIEINTRVLQSTKVPIATCDRIKSI